MFVRIPHLYILTDMFKVEKRRVVFAQRLNLRASLVRATQHAARGRSCQVPPMELWHVDLLGGLQSGFGRGKIGIIFERLGDQLIERLGMI